MRIYTTNFNNAVPFIYWIYGFNFTLQYFYDILHLMKLPYFHRYYSINILIYLILIHAISTPIAFFQIQNTLLDYIYVQALVLSIITLILIPIDTALILIELVLRNRGLIKKQNTVNISPAIQKPFFLITIIAIFYIIWFWICYLTGAI